MHIAPAKHAQRSPFDFEAPLQARPEIISPLHRDIAMFRLRVLAAEDAHFTRRQRARCDISS